MTDHSIDRAAVVAAVGRAGPRTADVIAAIGDPGAPTRGLSWTLGQTAAHVVAAVGDRLLWLRGEGRAYYGVPHLPELNVSRLEAVGEQDPARLAALLREHTAALVRDASAQPAGAAVEAEVGPALGVEVVLAITLGELLVHGFDMARSLRRPFPIDGDDAALVAAGGLSILPQFVNEDAARGVSLDYDVHLRGGPRAVVRIRDGALTVEPAAPGTRVDCHILADPTAFVLVGYGRIGQWGPILRGKMLAWGRKPWAGLRFTSYLRSP